jgi:hypothetical protein
MATIVLTGKTVGEVILIGQTLSGLAAAAAGGGVDNRAIGTCTVTDASPAVITVGTTVKSI